MASKDPARNFFVLAHAIIASEMSVRAVSRRHLEPDDNDPIHVWYAWRTRYGLEGPAEIRVPE